MSPLPNAEEYDCDKFESTLSKVVFTKVSAFLVNRD